MKQSNITILSTRPLAQAVIEEAEEQSIQIDTASFIETKNTIDKIVGDRIMQLASKEVAVVFTSMNAAEAVIDCLKALNADPEWTIYSLGGITQAIIEQHFTASEVFAEAINSSQLAQSIIDNEEEEVVFFCGNLRRDELPALLQQNHIKLEELVVYETIETPVKIDKPYSGILFFSPSAVKSFFTSNKIDDSTVLFAIGTTTATELKKFSSNKVLIGSRPNKEYLAQQAIAYLTKNVVQ
jgi:uroporphyrinogen-III synthase